MTIRKNPGVGDDAGREAFVDHVASGLTKRLHCLIPAELHREARLLAVEEDTDVTRLVIEGLRMVLAQRKG